MIAPLRIIRAADLFCGAGGSSTGMLAACRELGYQLDLTAVNHWPVAVETRTANLGRRACTARLPCGKRPDCDNLMKGVCDVLTKARFWHDDGQLADVRILKLYAAVGEAPCIEICIAPLGSQQPQFSL